MKKEWVVRAGLLYVVCVTWLSVIAASAAGLERQTPTNLRLPAATPNVAFTTENIFPSLSFPSAVVITAPPGETNRLFIVEQAGRIQVITDLAAPTKTVFLNIASQTVSGGEQGLLGLAFHPGYATNGYFYVFYTRNSTTSAGTGLHDRLSRFTVSANDPNVADASSEVVLIDQRDQASNHNGGDLHFGPDGYLYVSLGDEGGGNDQFNNSQFIDRDFYAGIIRIDVDKRAGNLAPNPHPAVTDPPNYSVPADNPFVNATSFNGRTLVSSAVRTEFWATGLRNPWRMFFDRDILYVGDVGQGALEEIDVIVKGGNYGWAYREGTRTGPKSAPAGFTSIPPILEYGRTLGASVTGGVVYRGRRMPELRGKYIFADYVSGRIWSATPNGTNTVPYSEIGLDAGISGFGIDPRNGDVLLADHGEGRIKRLTYAAQTPSGTPATLADTGLFANTTNLQPATGVAPFDVNLEYWTDGLQKQRWFAIPTGTISATPSNTWIFPAGSVWVQHFNLQMTNGVAASTRKIETRVLVKTTNDAYGLSFRWNAEGTAATVVGPGGQDETFTVHDNGSTRNISWRFPSRGDCLRCHSAAAGWAIGFQPWQLNREMDYGSGRIHQIEALRQAGYLHANVTNTHLAKFPVHPTNNLWSAEYRVRSWLAANCAHCHQPQGNGAGSADMRLALSTDETGLINGTLRAPRGDARLIVPGSLELSEVYRRLVVEGAGHMPPLDSQIPDPHALPIIAQWITNALPSRVTFEDWQSTFFGDAATPNGARLADPDGDHAPNYLEFLTGTNPTNALEAWGVAVERNPNVVSLKFEQVPNRVFEVQTRDSLSPEDAWRPLDSVGNRPSVTSSPLERTVNVQPTEREQYFRVRVFEP